MYVKTPREKMAEILPLLSKEYPDAKAELNFSNPFETLIATMLSAQCTDKRVNEVTKVLFSFAPDSTRMAKLSQEELEEIIKTCGLFHSKARHILDTCRELNDKYGGTVPNDKAALTALPPNWEKNTWRKRTRCARIWTAPSTRC